MKTLVKAIDKIKKIPAFSKDVYDDIRFVARESRLNIYRLEGDGIANDRLVLYHIGRKPVPKYLLSKFYLRPPREVIEDTIYPWRLKTTITALSAKANFITVRIHNVFSVFLKDNFIVMPEFVTQTLELTKEDREIESGFHENLYKTEFRHLRKYKYTYEHTDDLAKLEFFYNRMHIPFVTKRHKDYALVHPFEKIKKTCTAGLIFIKKDNQYVAGGTLHKKKDSLLFSQLGIIDGDESLFRQSVIAALYYFLIKYGKENGYKKLELGLSWPILSDGILLYKNKWGAKIECLPPNNLLFMMKICKMDHSVKTILSNNPLIALIDNKLSAVIFSDGKDKGNMMGKFEVPEVLGYFKGLKSVKSVALN